MRLKTKLLFIVPLLVALAQVVSPAISAPGYLVAKVAIFGDPTPLGGTFSQFFDNPPSLNNLGQLAFDGFVTGGSKSRAIFFYNGSSLSALVADGDAAPGGGNFYGVTTPALNDSGQVTFRADAGIFRWSSGTFQAIARVGGVTPFGGTFRGFPLLSTGRGSINAAGHVVLRGWITGGTTSEAIFVWDGQNCQPIAVVGDLVPGGGTLASFGNATQIAPAINDDDDVIFWASVTGGAADEGLFLKQGDNLTTVAAAGQSTPIGGVYDMFTSDVGEAGPSLNNFDEVAFIAFITGGSAASAIFRWKQGTVTKSVATGDASPLGYTFVHLSTPTLNNQGKLAFRGGRLGTETDIFIEHEGALQAVLSHLEIPPVAGEWGAFSNPITFNDQGDVGFWARGNPWGNGIFMAKPDIQPPVFSNNPVTHLPLITPTQGITVTIARPVFDWEDAYDEGGVVSYTLTITGSSPFNGIVVAQETTAAVTTTQSIFTPTVNLPDAVYTWTVQAYDAAGNVSAPVTPTNFTIKTTSDLYLPIILK